MSDRRWLALGTLLIAFVLVLEASRTWPSVVDDAWISARYARNLALGHGLVYNAGEAPVEGYTNLAYVVLLAITWRLGADMHTAMCGWGLCFALLGLPASVWLTRQLERRPTLWALAPAALLAIDPHYDVVATNGIESSMFVTGVITACAVALAARDARPALRIAAGLLIGAVAAVRPEGIAVAAGLAIFDLVARRDRLRDPSSWALVAGTLAWGIPIWGGRRLYFGEWVPNTFAAKVHKSAKAQILFDLDYLSADWPFWVGVGLLLLLALGTALYRKDLRSGAVVAIACGIVFVGFQVDMWMPGGRLLLPMVALVACLSGARLCELAERARELPLVVVALIAAPLLYGPLPNWVRYYDWRHSPLPDNPAARAGQFIAAHAPPGATIATRDAGVLAYFVGPDVPIAELHERALTRPHPNGKDADIKSYTPKNPEFVAPTVQRDNTRESHYADDRTVFKGLTEPYVYLGRVYQHYHRYYDIYARADLNVPPLPPEDVVNFDGPEAPVSAPGPSTEGRKKHPPKPTAPPSDTDPP